MGGSRRIRATALLAAAIAAALAAGGTTQAGPPGKWTRITAANTGNSYRLGLARTEDRTLHVAWHRASGQKWDLMHTSITPSGAASDANPIVSSWTALSNPDLVRLQDGRLRAYFGGSRSGPADPNQGLNTAVAAPNGRAWDLRSGAVSPRGESPSAAVKRGGIPVAAVNVPELVVLTGVDPSEPLQTFENRCCTYDPAFGVDDSNGELVLGWYSLVRGEEGYWAQSIDPRKAKRKMSGQVQHDGQRVAITGRIGAPGVYVAFCDGAPSCKNVVLWRHGVGSARRVSAAPGARFVNIATAPSGRLWVMWMRENRLLATRSNKAATAFGPIVSSAPPPGTDQIWHLQGEGSSGPLDLFASVSTSPTDLAYWHTQVYPQLTLSASQRTFSAKKPAKVTFSVRDAGDPVAGATVKVGGKAGTTAANGKVTIAFPTGFKPGRYSATARLAGYREAAAVRVTATG